MSPQADTAHARPRVEGERESEILEAALEVHVQLGLWQSRYETTYELAHPTHLGSMRASCPWIAYFAANWKQLGLYSEPSAATEVIQQPNRVQNTHAPKVGVSMFDVDLGQVHEVHSVYASVAPALSFVPTSKNQNRGGLK